jgi:glycosyltransferase involved in cell wall biosynthesis
VRLLYLADPFLPVPPPRYGGIERIVASLARQARAAGHQVALAAHPDSDLPGVRLYPLAGGAHPGRLDMARNLGRVRAAVKDFRPDAVHSFARLAYLLPVLATSVPKIMSFQREPTGWTVRGAARLAGESLTFVGCSEAISRRGRALGGRWETIANGIDLERYSFRDRVAPDAPLVFLSRIERVKGAHHAIAAARGSGRELILAGNRAATGPEAVYWESEIAPHLGRDGISYAGEVDDRQKAELLGRARALLVPIEWEEPFGIVFIEALACGTPVISHRRGALPEMIEEGRKGFLCGSPAELVEAIGRVGGLSRADCRAKAESYFSSALIFERYEQLYRLRPRRDAAKSTAR